MQRTTAILILAAAGLPAGEPPAAAAPLAPTKRPRVTFYQDVLPVLQKNCQSCHRPGEAAPMSFLTYESTRPWAKAIKQAVLTQKMPPWFASDAPGHFSNDRRMSENDQQLLATWADSGAHAGDAKDAPKPVEFAEGWSIGKPDLVLEMPAPYKVPASGTIDYTYFVVPMNFREDVWVEASEIRPGDRAVVHHAIAFVRKAGSKWMAAAKVGEPFVPTGQRSSTGAGEDGMGDDWLAAYAPGAHPLVAQAGQARLIPAGSDIILQMHYTTNGTAAVDRTRIGLRFARGPVKQRLMMAAVLRHDFEIPPGAAAHPVEASLRLTGPVEIRALMPHMHVRGRSFAMSAVLPDGRREELLTVPRWDFNWQQMYELAGRRTLPAGARIEASATFDNSVNNPHNPDASKPVRWGDQSWEEMMIGFFDVALPVDKSLADVIETPKRSR